jgi:alanine racemase
LFADTTEDTSGLTTDRGIAPVPDRYDPWVEVIPANLAHNAAALRQLGGSPILAVIKNHGYGLDYRVVARVLEPRPERTDRLRPGDSVSYGREYIATKPTWIATIPLGHGDGYARTAVKGAKVLVGARLYPVIGAVSASHSIIEVGDEERVHIGDVETFLGPDRPEIYPNEVPRVTGSVYDLLMHLNPALPRFVV